MKTMSAHEAASVQGGFEPFSLTGILVSMAVASVTYVAKDVYDNWGDFKEGFADGWNNV